MREIAHDYCLAEIRERRSIADNVACTTAGNVLSGKRTAGQRRREQMGYFQG